MVAADARRRAVGDSRNGPVRRYGRRSFHLGIRRRERLCGITVTGSMAGASPSLVIGAKGPWAAVTFDEPRRPGLEEVDRDGEALDGIGADGHRPTLQRDDGPAAAAAAAAAPGGAIGTGIPCSVPRSRASAARRR